MSVISIRVPNEIKEKMDGLDEDWPTLVKQMIVRKIEQHERMPATRGLVEIRSQTTRGTYNAARRIREDRDTR